MRPAASDPESHRRCSSTLGQGLLRVVVGTLAYLFLRISGKRTLTKLNAFDLVVTVALGLTLSSIVLTESVALLEGVLALATLIGLQYLITWSSVRSPRIKALVKAEPTLLATTGAWSRARCAVSA